MPLISKDRQVTALIAGGVPQCACWVRWGTLCKTCDDKIQIKTDRRAIGKAREDLGWKDGLYLEVIEPAVATARPLQLCPRPYKLPLPRPEVSE